MKRYDYLSDYRLRESENGEWVRFEDAQEAIDEAHKYAHDAGNRAQAIVAKEHLHMMSLEREIAALRDAIGTPWLTEAHVAKANAIRKKREYSID